MEKLDIYKNKQKTCTQNDFTQISENKEILNINKKDEWYISLVQNSRFENNQCEAVTKQKLVPITGPAPYRAQMTSAIKESHFKGKHKKSMEQHGLMNHAQYDQAHAF